jgi:hypothetical protein
VRGADHHLGDFGQRSPHLQQSGSPKSVIITQQYEGTERHGAIQRKMEP